MERKKDKTIEGDYLGTKLSFRKCQPRVRIIENHEGTRGKGEGGGAMEHGRSLRHESSGQEVVSNEVEHNTTETVSVLYQRSGVI